MVPITHPKCSKCIHKPLLSPLGEGHDPLSVKIVSSLCPLMLCAKSSRTRKC